jgi:hypothetical protein
MDFVKTLAITEMKITIKGRANNIKFTFLIFSLCQIPIKENRNNMYAGVVACLNIKNRVLENS